MAIAKFRVLQSRLRCYCAPLPFPTQMTGEFVKKAVEAKEYHKIPDVLTSFYVASQIPNPFLFLSSFEKNLRTQVIDEILQSFVTIRPTSRLRVSYERLLNYTLRSPEPLPISLAVLQQTILKKVRLFAEVRALVSYAWTEQRIGKSQPVQKLLSDMKLIGYHPDGGTCNYILISLCSSRQVCEALKVLKGMAGVRCFPDSVSYGIVIEALSKNMRTTEAVGLVKEMVERVGLSPTQRTLAVLMKFLKKNRDMWRAVEVVEFLEMEGQMVGFESYELLVKGCLSCCEYILAGKAAMMMTDKGFVPHISSRQKVVDSLAGINELELSSIVRQRFSDMQC